MFFVAAQGLVGDRVCHGQISTLKILGSEVPRSMAVLCTDSLVARPRGTKIRREVVLIRVLNSLGGNKDYRDSG